MRVFRRMLPRLFSVLLLVTMVGVVIFVGVQSGNSSDEPKEVVFSDDGYDFSFSTTARKYELNYVDSGFELYSEDNKLLDAVIVRDGVQYFNLESDSVEQYSGFTYKDCYKIVEEGTDGTSVIYIKMPSGTVVRLIVTSDLDLSAVDVNVTEQVTTEETVEQ